MRNELETLVEDIKRRALVFFEIYFVHIPKNGNSVANAITKFARGEKSSVIWNCDVPEWIHVLVLSDCFFVAPGAQ